MHFLKDLLESPIDPEPLKNLPHVHKHLIRYSKGNFVGPAAKIRFSKNITIDGSFEFEDLFAWLAANLMISQNYEEEIQITGVILSDKDFSERLYEIGLDSWKVKKSTGKTKNFKCVLATPVPISSVQLKDLVEKLNSGSICYIMLNFNTGSISLKTKKKPPRPKTKGDKTKVVTIAEKVKFTKLKLPNTDYIRDLIIDEILPDFKDEITSSTKLVTLECSYDINDLILPPKELRKNSSSIRRLTLRKGTLERHCVIDKEPYNITTEFSI